MKDFSEWAMPIEELERRRDGVLHWMNDAGVALSIIIDPANLVYLSGIDIGGRSRGKAMILAADGRYVFVTRTIECHWQQYWQSRSWCREWAFHDDDESLAQAITRLSKTFGIDALYSIGIDLSSSNSVISFTAVQELLRLPDIVIDVGPAIAELRTIKSQYEIRALRRSGEISVTGADAAAAAIHNGASSSEATAEAFRAIVCCDGSQLPVSGPHVTSGPRTAMAHNTWNQETPQDGDCVAFVMTGTCERYSAPIEWTVTRGEPSTFREKLLRSCDEAGEAIISGLKPGMTSHQGDLLCRQVFEEAGLSQYFMNRAAYGLGICYGSWMESLVQLKPNDDTEIQPGMTMHIVPALHVPEHGFIIRTSAIEVTESGCASLRPPVKFGSIL